MLPCDAQRLFSGVDKRSAPLTKPGEGGNKGEGVAIAAIATFAGVVAPALELKAESAQTTGNFFILPLHAFFGKKF